MPDLPKFYGKSGSRTRPSRRRPDPIVLTPHEATRQRSLSKAFLVIGAIVALLSLSAAGITQFARHDSPATTTTRPTVVAVSGAVLVDVVRVIDGDTLDVRAAQTELRVRLYGGDTPERGDRCYNEATERMRVLAGSQVQLVSDARQRDRYDRELRYAFTAGGESIDATLIREGLAVAWREDGAQRAALIALEDRARAAKSGCLWSGA
ncbi:MAG: thermonuclease family protein [Dehalococcoidia bacterium]|nr:MAG: thermonuclease family protein [Dehalococcoidia bacterium]